MFSKLSAFIERLKTSIATEVPADVSACEFDCRHLSCPEKNWEECPKRLHQEMALQKVTFPAK